MYFRQYWVDDRLIDLFNHITTQTNDSSSSIQLGTDYLGLIWLPDIYWTDAVVVSKPGILAESQSLQLSYDGSIFFSSRLLVDFRCAMKLRFFPFDIQDCQLCFESCRFTQAFLSLCIFTKLFAYLFYRFVPQRTSEHVMEA